jgi:hypothetical protein
MKRLFLPLFCTAVLASTVLADQTGTQIQPRKLIDAHTAGSLPKGYYDVGFGFFSGGGLNTAINVGLTNRLSIGIAYQVMGLIGQDEVRGQSFPGGFFKYRLMEESYSLPAIAFGFDSQGGGPFYKKSMSEEFFPRFYYKSKGLFAAISKSYLFIGQPFGIHLESNYSVVDNQAESEEDNRYPNFTLGFDQTINDELSLVTEYNLGLDDNNDRDIRDGLWNAGIKWSLIKTLVIEIDFIDMLSHKKIFDISQDMSREVRITYIDRF